MDETMTEVVDMSQETPAEDVFKAPSILLEDILMGHSYAHYSPVPAVLKEDMMTECVLGVDEAGRGPVLGPMVYGVFYLPLSTEQPLLVDTHHFDDSKVLTPAVRSDLMEKLCTTDTDLYKTCGWATKVMSARDISAGMLKPIATYNLNAQAMDATIELIRGVFALGINVKHIYIDTIGRPEVYQRKLERIFPNVEITVAKKADSLYPCVSAASVCAKVTRDAALEVAYETYTENSSIITINGWGSGYPSDSRCVNWLKQNIDPVFGWGSECRFSWGTSKDILEGKGSDLRVDWPDMDDDNGTKMTDFFTFSTEEREQEGDELSKWYGRRVTEGVF
ncbi:hypothetical protein M501DRAFT_1007003 [Patellaria atrata CBS 101060]|uniref:Ribonuclease n=1 Tax=Patellaria atrata CBS 101060 TaxID=1346257 RepID=A0A9P4S711_9PEZI|nr:hypothetical protein M501DRAFT_1007003 [Patellaria atrata CBS 101060]